MNTSMVSGQSSIASKGLKRLMQQHPLFFYFLLAYAISWVVFIPYVLAEWGIMPGAYSFFSYTLHTFGPTLATIIMTSLIAGKAGLHELRQRIRQWRTPWQWYLFILLGIPALVLIWNYPQARGVRWFSHFSSSNLQLIFK